MTSASRRYPHRNLHGQIVHTLGRRILRGDIRPGDALQAGTAMAASRTALREAIKVLAAKGLVEARPKVGTRVSPRESWNLLDPDVMAWLNDGTPRPTFLKKLTEVRSVIEPPAAALAAERIDSATAAALEAAFADMSTACAKPGGDVDRFVEADMRFHLLILRASGNELLEQMTRTVYSALVVSFRTTSRLPGSSRRSLPKHREILRAILAGQSRKAHAAMESLVAETAREIGRIPNRDLSSAPEREPRVRESKRARTARRKPRA
jgi:DNA-binding FadR family transcriptional regulator